MSPAFSVSPKVALRGQRDYFHSTDLYLELVAALGANAIVATDFDLKIKNKITVQPRMDFYNCGAPELNESVAAIAKFATTNGDWMAVVSQLGEPITARKSYDEGAIWSKITRDQTRFEVAHCESYTPIEVVAATGVFAHKTLFPPRGEERWLLAQIMASRLLDTTDLEYLVVDVARQLGPRLTQSTLINNGGIFGKMLFILK